MKLNAKEKRLFDYYLKCIENKITPTIGDICRDCRATPYTLLVKTEPSLTSKLKSEIDGINQGDIELVPEVM